MPGPALPVAAAAAKAGGVSSVLGSIGKVVGIGGALNSIFGGKSHDKSWKQRLQFLVQDAKAAGIHPLAALGASANYSPNFTTTGSAAGDGLQALGLNLEQIGAEAEAKRRSGVSDAFQERRLALEERKLAASGEMDAAQAAYWNSMTALNKQRLAALGRDALNGNLFEMVPAQVTPSSKEDSSVQAGPSRPFNVPITYGEDEYGKPLRGKVPDQNMGDAELPANFYWFMNVLNEGYRALRRRFGGYSNSKGDAKWERAKKRGIGSSFGR